MKVSSVSPERCEMMEVVAGFAGQFDGVDGFGDAAIWLSAFDEKVGVAMPSLMTAGRGALVLVTKRFVADELDFFFGCLLTDALVSDFQPAQSSPPCVLDGNDGICSHQFVQYAAICRRSVRDLSRFLKTVLRCLVVELAGGGSSAMLTCCRACSRAAMASSTI